MAAFCLLRWVGSLTFGALADLCSVPPSRLLAVLVPASGLGFSALYCGGQSYTGGTSLYYWLVFSGFALLFGALQVRVARPSP